MARIDRHARAADRAPDSQDPQERAAALPGRRSQARDALPGAGLRPRAGRVPRSRRRRHLQRLRPLSARARAPCCRIATASRNRCAWHSTWPRCAKTPSASRSFTSAATSPTSACSTRRWRIACSNPPPRSSSKTCPRRAPTCRASRAFPTTSSAWCSPTSVRAPTPTRPSKPSSRRCKHPVDLDGQIFQLAPQIGVTLSGTDGDARHRAHRTRAHHARFRPAPGRGSRRHVLFRHAAPRLAHAPRLAAGAHAGAAERRARAALPAAPAAGDARDRRGRGLPALAAQDSRHGAHLRIPADRRAVGAVGAARPLGAAARLPRSRDAGASAAIRSCACR